MNSRLTSQRDIEDNEVGMDDLAASIRSIMQSETVGPDNGAGHPQRQGSNSASHDFGDVVEEDVLELGNPVRAPRADTSNYATKNTVARENEMSGPTEPLAQRMQHEQPVLAPPAPDETAAAQQAGHGDLAEMQRASGQKVPTASGEPPKSDTSPNTQHTHADEPVPATMIPEHQIATNSTNKTNLPDTDPESASQPRRSRIQSAYESLRLNVAQKQNENQIREIRRTEEASRPIVFADSGSYTVSEDEIASNHAAIEGPSLHVRREAMKHPATISGTSASAPTNREPMMQHPHAQTSHDNGISSSQAGGETQHRSLPGQTQASLASESSSPVQHAADSLMHSVNQIGHGTSKYDTLTGDTERLISAGVGRVISSELEKLQNQMSAASGATRPNARLSANVTMQELVVEAMKPMLRQWLDQHLASIVQSMIQREIKPIVEEMQARLLKS